MSTVLAAAAAPDDDDGGDGILDRCRCACGRLAAIVFEIDGNGTSCCAIRCPCGAFTPPEGSRP